MIKLACVNCGAPLEIGADMDTFACAYCGTTQMVERKGGTIALRRVEAAIKAVQRGTDLTAAELALPRLRSEEADLLRERADLIRKAKEARDSASRGRAILAFLAFAATWMVAAATLIPGGRILGHWFEDLRLTLASLAGVAAVVFVFRRSKLPPDVTPALTAAVDSKLERVREQVSRNRELLDRGLQT